MNMADNIFMYDNEETVDETNEEVVTYSLAKYKDQYAIMSNYLAQAMEKTNLLESKIELLAINLLSRDVKQVIKKDAEGTDYKVNCVVINSSDLKALTGRDNSGSLYDQMKTVAFNLKTKVHLIEDEKGKGFRAHAQVLRVFPPEALFRKRLMRLLQLSFLYRF